MDEGDLGEQLRLYLGESQKDWSHHKLMENLMESTDACVMCILYMHDKEWWFRGYYTSFGTLTFIS